MPLEAANFSESAFLKHTNVSRETISDYTRWQQLLTRWNKRINLVAPKSLPDFWYRHALDSWQVCVFLPAETAKTAPKMVNKAPQIVDFGSGAGFPGISAAIACKHGAPGQVTLIESAGKKASFLRQVIRELDLPAKVIADRIEAIDPLAADVITARAFAPLDKLLQYAAPHSKPSTRYVLLKGASAEAELEKAREQWTFTSKTVKSITDEAASILLLSDLRAKPD